MIFTINDCTIDTDAYEVRRRGIPVAAEPQVFDLLVLLLASRDRVVTKDEIIERVWKGRIVSDAALSSRIKAVRQVVGDDGTSQACIRTIRGRGFRVVAPVTQSAGPVDAADRPQGGSEALPGSHPDRLPMPADAGAHPPGAAEALIDPYAFGPNGAAAGRWRSVALAAIVVVVVLGSTAGWYSLQLSRDSALPIAALGMPSGPGIAVLRFGNLSGDPSLDFFGEAVTEEISTELTRFSELRVAGRHLASEYDSRDIDARDIGRVLGVEFLLQGSLRRSGERVRVTAQLLKTIDGTLLWGETYERPTTPTDIFAVQEDIASKVVAAIASISVGVIARETLHRTRGKPAPRDLSAYECTLRANEMMMSGFSAASHLAARTCLEAAVENEPEYASAWAILAWVHTLEYSYGYNLRSGDPRERALAAARRAVELAPANPIARFGMARAAYLMGDLDLFYAEAASALTLNPHEPLLLGNLGNWLAFSGRWEEGVALVKKAIALNSKVYPRWWHAAIAKDHYRKGEYEAALVEFKRMNLPDWWWNQVELAYTYGQIGDKDGAERARTRLVELYPGFDLETAVMEHRKYSFEQSYIDRAIDGLRKAGVPAKSMALTNP